MEIFTIGHSTHSEQEFLDLLADTTVTLLVDVRAFPGSRKFPHFHKDQMKLWLSEAGYGYAHIEELGGRKKKSNVIDDDLNEAWNNRSFHNYADYTLTEEFAHGLQQLTTLTKDHTVAYCCSERHPARCHRLLISNWLSLNGWNVKHILDGYKNETSIVDHKPGQWGAPPILREDGTVIYPIEKEVW